VLVIVIHNGPLSLGAGLSPEGKKNRAV